MTKNIPLRVRIVVLLFGCVLSACTGVAGVSPKSGVTDIPKSTTALAFVADENLQQRLSKPAQTALSAAEAQALEFGQPGQSIDWKAGIPEASGTVIAYQPFRVGQSNCRRFVHRIQSGSEVVNTTGTACRSSDMAWTLVQ